MKLKLIKLIKKFEKILITKDLENALKQVYFLKITKSIDV